MAWLRTRSTPPVDLVIHRQPESALTGRAAALAGLWHGSAGTGFGPALVERIGRTGALPRCLFLAGVPGGPLRWRYIGDIEAFGPRWARDRLGRVHDDGDVFADYAAAIGAEYRVALASGGPLVNHVVADLPRHAAAPALLLRYRQLLLPWFAGDGRAGLLVHTERC